MPGIGPALKEGAGRAFGSVEGVRQASDEELSKVKGLSPLKLRRLRELLGV